MYKEAKSYCIESKVRKSRKGTVMSSILLKNQQVFFTDFCPKSLKWVKLKRIKSYYYSR